MNIIYYAHLLQITVGLEHMTTVESVPMPTCTCSPVGVHNSQSVYIAAVAFATGLVPFVVMAVIVIIKKSVDNDT